MTAPGAGASCIHCGTANHGDARFCGVCGRAMAATEPSSANLGEAPVMIGREIAGRYRILAKLGEGGMGAVFRAEQISLKRTVAVKLLRPEVLGNQMLLRRFNVEAEAVAKLNHPNTVNIYDFGQDTDGTLFIAMELIEGRSLRSVIHGEAPLLPRRALAIAAQLARSLADAHAHSIVHRDLKPDNVMLQDRGRERDIVRVLDFGIAKLRDDTRATQNDMTQQGDMLGTPQYMAPEQIRAGAIDGRTDIYALGCMLYVMVTGRLPHEAQTILALLSKHLLEHPVPPSQRRPELKLPVELDRLILGAMAKDPKDRPPTMEAYGEQIAALLADQPRDPHSAQRSAAGPVAVPQVATGAPGTTQPSFGGGPFAPQAATPMPYAGGPVPGALPFAPRPSAGNHTAVIVLVVVVAAAALVGGLVVVVRDVAAKRDAHALSPSPSDDRTGKDDKADHRPDPWAGSSPLDGDKLAVGQGVSLIVPSGFRTTVQNGFTGAYDARGVAIMAGPIAIATDDPMQLAKFHARSNNLVFESMDHVFIGGVQRPMAIFHGTVAGTPVRHVAVALIGPGYRIAVMFQAPAALATSDPAVQALAFELYTRRVILP
jgi:tRNA A-37 threonylcarbamoyl transferase component Bud32